PGGVFRAEVGAEFNDLNAFESGHLIHHPPPYKDDAAGKLPLHLGERGPGRNSRQARLERSTGRALD
ncbi:MAG TPA: hypothetical protein VMS37_31320, partial [Verrucomicrobiae bacterium]|nr:hypothetical protein [Verrucomicrobiae bacterium]